MIITWTLFFTYHKGCTALDAAIQTLKIDKTDDRLSTGRQQVVKFLRNYKGRPDDGTELRRRNTAFHSDSEEEDSSGGSIPSALKRFNEKLKKKEMERLQGMNGTFCEDSSPEDIDQIDPKKTSKELLREDDDLQGNHLEVIQSFPSSSSTRFQSNSGNHIEKQATGLRTDDMVCCDDAERFSDVASEDDGNDNGDGDSTYSSMDEGNNGIEMIDWNDQDSVIMGATLVDPVAETRNSSHLSGRVPSLVTQKTADWLVDDVGPRTVKRKRPAKQAKLPGSLQRRKRINSATITRPKHGLSPSTSQNLPRAKQSTLAVSKEVRTYRNLDSSVDVSNPLPSRPNVVSTVSGANSGLNVSTTTPRHIVAPGGTPPMRLRVRVQDKVFLIPCPQGSAQEAKNIGWLAEQVSEQQ